MNFGAGWRGRGRVGVGERGPEEGEACIGGWADVDIRMRVDRYSGQIQ